MKLKSRWLLAVAVIAFSATVARAQELSPRLEVALEYLPPQSETLAVDQSSLTIPLDRADDDKGDQAATLGDSLLPANLQLSVVAPALAGRTIELSLEARSNFRAPKGFGLMPYDGCGLVYLKPQEAQTRAMLKTKVWKGMKRTTLAGQEIGFTEFKSNNDLWRVYVAVPRPDLIVLATDRASMITALSRMQRPILIERAFPASWSGWKLVDTRAPNWAIRRLDLPQSTGFPLAIKRDPKARAFVVYSRPPKAGEPPQYVMKYDGTPEKVQEMFATIKREVAGTITRPKGTQITQFTATAPDGYFTFYALGLLGTGIYL